MERVTTTEKVRTKASARSFLAIMGFKIQLIKLESQMDFVISKSL
jgi:hypothetical protein